MAQRGNPAGPTPLGGRLHIPESARMLWSLTALAAFCRRGEASRKHDASASSPYLRTNGVRGRFPCCANLAIQGGRLHLHVASDYSQFARAAPSSPDGATGWDRFFGAWPGTVRVRQSKKTCSYSRYLWSK